MHSRLESHWNGPTTAPEPLLVDPITGASLWRMDRVLTTADGRRRFRVIDGPTPLYDLFVDEGDDVDNPRSAARWSRDAFDAHYEESGFYEDGISYEVQQGGHERLSAFHHARVKDLLLEWMSVGAGHTVLDVGCGAGWFLERITQRYRDAGHSATPVGLEASALQARFTARRMARGHMNGAVAVLGNAEHLPFADASFDVVTCSETLEQVRNPGRAIREMARVLKPGGQLLLSAPSRLNEVLWDLLLAPAVTGVKRLLGRPEGAPFEEFYAPLYPEELQSLVAAAGLGVKRVELTGLIPHPHYFSQLPNAAVPWVVSAFEWFDRRFRDRVPELAAHILIEAQRPSER